MLYKTKPKKFYPTAYIVSCYCLFQDQILLLKRHPQKNQGRTWGPPAGKVNSDENMHNALLREVKEETGISLSENDIQYIGKYFVKLPEFHYTYQVFKSIFSLPPKILLASNEHIEYQWLTPQQALQLNLVKDEDQSIKLTFGL